MLGLLTHPALPSLRGEEGRVAVERAGGRTWGQMRARNSHGRLRDHHSRRKRQQREGGVLARRCDHLLRLLQRPVVALLVGVRRVAGETPSVSSPPTHRKLGERKRGAVPSPEVARAVLEAIGCGREAESFPESAPSARRSRARRLPDYSGDPRTAARAPPFSVPGPFPPNYVPG